ncbi:ferredoxin [Pseudonocardia sp. RS11V-5]|uniref:ferredoxin n=1 Tax=Pseudonocardia terrae TaxID=2905831 RepID=UPI001E6169DD|nr:ferredoxin [Pseudonocardia terrae]MCE3551224.1 ferredoxin [Pseudonocardia terrae]
MSVDMDRCVYTLQCTYHAPTVFDVNDDGEMTYTTEVAGDAAEAVRTAAELCPSQAIRLAPDTR